MDSDFWIHTVAVQPYLGPGPAGDIYGPSQDVLGLWIDGISVTTEAGGEQLAEGSTFYCDRSNASVFPPKTKVTYNGRTSIVDVAHDYDGATILDDVSHLEVILK